MSSKHKLFKELEFLGYDPISIRNVLLTQNTFEGALQILSQNKEQHIRSELIKFGVPVRMARRLAAFSNSVDEAYKTFNDYLPVADTIRSHVREMGFPSNSAEFLISEMVPLELAIEKLLSDQVPDENITIQAPKIQLNRNFNYSAPPTMNPVPIIPRPTLEPSTDLERPVRAPPPMWLPREPPKLNHNAPGFPPQLPHPLLFTPFPGLPPHPTGLPPPPTGLPPLTGPSPLYPGYYSLPRPPPIVGFPQPQFNYLPPPSGYYPAPNYPPTPNYPPPRNYAPVRPNNVEEQAVFFNDDELIMVPEEQQSIPRRRRPDPIGPPTNPPLIADENLNPPSFNDEGNFIFNPNSLGNNFQEAYDTITIAQMNRNNQDPDEEFVIYNPLFDLILMLEQYRGIQFINLLGSMYQDQGVPEEEFQKLDREKYSIALGLTTDNCVICMEDFEMDLEIVILQCRHGFHTDCIGSWLKKSELCPLCKAKVTGE